MAGGVFSGAKLNGMTIRESATDGSDFTNPDADYRRLFLGEDGALHPKDPTGAVTTIGGSALTVKEEGSALATAADTLDFVGAGVVASGTGTTKTITIAGGGGGGGIGEYASKYNPDHETPTVTPDAAEEFNGATGMAWDSAPATDDLTTYPGFLHLQGSNAERYLTKAWTPGASDITVVAKFSAHKGATDAGSICLCVGSATGNPADGVYNIFELEAATLTTFSLYNRNSSSFALVGAGRTVEAKRNAYEKVYLRITRAITGPVWTASLSLDGKGWMYGLTTGSKALTVASFGIRTDGNHDVMLDWVRCWKSVVSAVGA